MKTGIDKIIDKVNFQIQIVEMDFNNGVEISMRVFNKMLKEIKTQCEKEKAKEKNKYSEEEILNLLWKLFSSPNNQVDFTTKEELTKWFEQFKKK